MKTNPIKKLLMLVLLGIAFKSQAQYALVNLLSKTITGQTDTVPMAPILKVANTYVVSANQKINATQNDFKTTCLNGNVVTVWLQLYNASNKKAFTTATTKDAAGNIYIAGSTYINGLNGQDLTVMKRSQTGQLLWVQHYNGPGNSYDIASGITVNNSGDVFVTGASIGFLFALVDFVTIKINSAGIQQWVARYNYSNGMDIPAGIILDNSGNVIVSGSSSSSSTNNNWDFATVKYNSSTGAQMQVQRQSNAGNAQDKVIAQTKDANGNIYTTGITSSNGSNFNVQTIKYDQNMNVVWVQTFDAHGNYDQGTDIAIDNSGNVLVTGYSTRSNLTKELLLLNYSSTGLLNWKVLKQPTPDLSNAEGLKIRIKSNNEIFVGGNYTINNNSDMAILRFDNNGVHTLEKTYNGVSNLNDQLLDFMVDGNYIIVSGKTNNGVIDQNVTIKYEYKDYTETLATSPTHGKHDANKIIIYFNKSALKMNMINDRGFLFGKLIDFVQDSTCDKINNLINPALKCQNFIASKIFYNLTEADSISISRQGDNVKIPPFYCALLIETPAAFDIFLASDTLSHIKPDINYAELNHAYELTFAPNDTKYVNNDQGSLAATPSFQNSNINCTQAWNYTKGENYIRVGVYDSGIDNTNSDLTGVVAGGFDYHANTSITNVDNANHGTACAGIIGAKSNNNNGVAGIAGGDHSISQNGVSLFNMRITSTGVITDFVPTHKIGQAMVNGASGVNIGGNALHVMSNSWVLSTFPYDNFVMDGINYANRNGVVFCESSGNDGVNHPYFPSDLKEQTILCIGASGLDGHYANPSNGASFSPNYGYPLDLVAPGITQLVNTTKVGVNSFGGFDGTSAAAPHVAGSAALLLSYYNTNSASWDNLTHEDCEEILQRSCTDLANGSYGETAGWDAKTGHGRLNIGAALASIEKPKYKIRHIDEFHYANSTSKQVNTIVNNQVRFFAGNSVVAAGLYIMDVYETITTLNYSLGPNEQVVGSWAMYKASTGTAYYPSDILTDEPWYCDVLSANGSQAVLRTYSCLIKTSLSAQTINYVYPMPAMNVNSALSLYTFDPTAVGIKDNKKEISTFNVYPNPSNGNFTVGLHSNNSSTCNLIVTDLLGNKVFENNNLMLHEGVNKFDLAINNLSSGIYFVTLNSQTSNSITKKIIIE